MVFLVLLNAGVVLGTAVYFGQKESIVTNTSKLEAVALGVGQSLDLLLNDIREDLTSRASGPTVRRLITEFGTALQTLPAEDKTQFLQKAYIDDNPNELGKKHLLDVASGDTYYNKLHAEYHPWMRQWLELRGYYDIFLFDKSGNVVYTVFKERDFATNAVTGQWKDSGLMQMFRDIKANPQSDKVLFYDFEEYAPSNNAPAAFMGVAVFDKDNFIGVLAIQMPIDAINKITQVDKKISKTMHVHLIGSDGLVRNDPKLDDDENPILKEKYETEGFKTVNAGASHATGMFFHDGTEVLSAYESFDVLGQVKWIISAEIEKDEVYEGIYEMALYSLIGAVISILIVAGVGLGFSSSLTRPINTMVAVMGTLANRDYSVDVPSQTRHDEIGDMAKAVQVFKENGLAVARMQEEQEQLKHQAEIDKKAALAKLADDFDSRTSGIIAALAAAATEMQATASQMTHASEGTSQASSLVAAAAAEADSNVQTVAAAAEELSASSSEIARQISSVAQKSNRASSEAATTSKEVAELNTLADSIGEVVGAIKDIAEQTNLLALNATIEAARAGEAGKGFAVVADEVKKLANETAAKTEEIDGRVVRIQQAIRSSVDAVQRIITDIRDIDGATSTVASAVEEQNAATAEIGRNVAEASTGTQQVAHNIQDVQRNATETSSAASTVQSAASELAKISDDLQVQVQRFLSEIRNG